MTFTVEDGTGLAAANAYVNVAYVDSYFLERNNIEWTGSTAVKQAAIVKATDFIETRWGNRFKGYPEFPDVPQALSFPRLKLVDRNGYYVTGIPEKLKKATAEYALRSLTKELLPDPTIDESGMAIANKREKVGPLEEETQFQTSGAAPLLLHPYPAADRLLAEYVTTSGTNFR